MMPAFAFDVFLSHNPQDKPRVRRLAERLRSAGVRVWFDEWIINPSDDIYLATENGLNAARTLVLCLSSAALDTNWVALERSTVLFRDPSNFGRRFIPLVLEDCDVPNTLRRYQHVDFRQESDTAFEELLTTCLSPVDGANGLSAAHPEHSVGEGEQPEGQEPPAALERQISAHRSWVTRLAVSPDGEWVASGSDDKTIKVWATDTGQCLATLHGYEHYTSVLEITPDGKLFAAGDYSVRVWDLHTGDHFATKAYGGYRQYAVMPAPHGRVFTGGAFRAGGVVGVWDFQSEECLWEHDAHNLPVTAMAVAQQHNRAVSASSDGTIRIWDLDNGESLGTLTGHVDKISTIQVTPDGQHAISGSYDNTIKIWDLRNGKCMGTLEGHQKKVYSVAISPDGSLIASAGSTDSTVRLWDWKTGACLQIIDTGDHEFPISLAFCPDGTRLYVGTAEGSIYLYQLRQIRPTLSTLQTRRYVNAKVVLVGESGVGKSGLAHRLIEDVFLQTHSTHGMQVWRLDLPLEHNDDLEREALLWDLAGQEDYRVIHQLFLDETALVLLLFNPQHDNPFREVTTWLKILRTAVPEDRARDVARLLVAARSDVGNIKVSKRKIERFLEENHIAAYLATSALRGDNCSDTQANGNASQLKQLISENIPWDKLPWTSTPRLLADLKNAVITMTEQRNIRLLRFAELAQRLEQALPYQEFGESEVRTAVTLLANHGLVLPLKFGDLVLLRPEVLNGYASAVISAARDHTDEIGCVKEQAVFDRSINLSGIERLEPADEELLMRAMVQTFLDKSLCIAEDTPQGRHLVFPSQYRQERPIPSHPEIFVSYSFSGEWQTIYTTLVVRLWYSHEFQHRELWRNAAEFETSKGRTLGLLMEHTNEGEGTISIFFDTDIPDELKVVFIEYIHRHLAKHARDVHRDRRYVCPTCSRLVREFEAVRERLEAKKDFIYCARCDARVPLIDHIEQRLASDPVASRVLRMDRTASQELDNQALEQILTGHMMAICGEANQIFREQTKFDYGIDGEIEFKDNDGAASGRKIYVQLKSGGSYLRTRKADGKVIFDLKKPRHLEYWVSQPVDVYLVVRDKEGAIRWMNVTRYLNDRRDKESQQIVFEGEKLDATAIWRVRDRYFR